MKVEAQFIETDQIKVKIEFEMSLYEWKRLAAHTTKDYAEPMNSFIKSINGMVKAAEQKLEPQKTEL